MRQFNEAARQALADDAPASLQAQMESAMSEIYRELQGIVVEAQDLRARMRAGSDEETGETAEVFYALGMLGHAGASGTIGSKFERIIAAQALIQGLSRGYKYGREA